MQTIPLFGKFGVSSGVPESDSFPEVFKTPDSDMNILDGHEWNMEDVDQLPDFVGRYGRGGRKRNIVMHERVLSSLVW